MNTASTASRNLAAEVRAVEEGHKVRIDHARGVFLVRSDSGPRTYALTAQGQDGVVVVSCDCPAGVRTQVPRGQVPCKHAALICQRLGRAGLVMLDDFGKWLITAKAARTERMARNAR